MNTTTQTHDSVWESIVDITNRLQKNALTASSVSKLLEVIAEGMLPIEKNDFSVVYQDYGTISPVFLIADGKVVSKEDSDFIEPFSIKNTSIIDIIHNAQDKPLYLGTNQECVEHGFPESYKSILITPLRLKENKTIGVLLAHSCSQEYVYQQLSTPFNSLSNTITFYLRSNIIRRRNNLFKDFHNGLIRQPHQKEADIISYLVDKLKSWFTHDDINIILINPFNTNEYLLACDKGVVNEDFRKSSSLTQNALNFLVGEMIPEISERPTIVNSIEEIKKHGITSGCKSWLGARMHTASDSNIGFIILQNFIAEHSYEIGEEKLVDDVSDFMAVVLTEYRKDQREKSLSKFKEMLFLEKLPSDIELYNQAQITLDDLYGVVPLAIVRTNRITHKLELAKNIINGFELDFKFAQELKKYIENCLKTNEKYNLKIVHQNSGSLLATPMKSGNDDLGCFLIPSVKCGPLTTRYIDDLSDIVAAIMDKQGKENVRLDLLNSFSETVSKIQTITKDEIIRITHKYVAKAMFSENLYIALYNKENHEISFPFMMINGDAWNQKSRFLDRNKLGKTEEILLTGLPVLHKTKAESEAWYKQPNHEEFTGNPLASWVGVPILSPDGAIGVIAAFHPDEEFVYTQGDLFFLQMLSHPVSGLFRALALEETNNKLRETQKLIVERESQLTNTAFIQDLAHRINNGVGSVYAEIDDSLNYIKEVLNGSESVDKLGSTIESLEQSLRTLDKIIQDTKFNKSPEPESINIFLMIKLISRQVSLEKKLNENIFDIRISKDSSTIRAIQQNLYQLLFILIENAGDAIREKGDYSSAYIKITSSRVNDDIRIEVTDNGVCIPKNIKLFELGNTSKKIGNGYGLWRAKIIAASLSGSIALAENTEQQKTFAITLKSQHSKKEREPLAFVIDDQEIWRNIISRWLKGQGYQVSEAISKESAIELIGSSKASPDVIFLDISLDGTNAFNSDGLQLIDIFKSRFSDAKIVVISGYSEKAELYKDNVDLIIEKVDNGVALRRSIFLEKTKNILRNDRS